MANKTIITQYGWKTVETSGNNPFYRVIIYCTVASHVSILYYIVLYSDVKSNELKIQLYNYHDYYLPWLLTLFYFIIIKKAPMKKKNIEGLTDVWSF